MNWEKLTAPEFVKAVAECGRVCILPIGVIEKHGDHVPLGMDAINAHEAAERPELVKGQPADYGMPLKKEERFRRKRGAFPETTAGGIGRINPSGQAG